MPVVIRPETPQDYDAIRQINIAAFANHPYSRQTEHRIVEALRAAGAMVISLVADDGGQVVGHIAFSAATIGAGAQGWYLLGPVAVWPALQRHGIGTALVHAGLDLLRQRGAHGCVLVGDPAYYRRFGFRGVAGVTCAGVPDEYVLCLPMSDEVPAGTVTHHPAFGVEA